MADARQRNIVLILARDFASRLATAVFLVDEEGDVIYFNEAAEQLLGQRFVEGEEMGAEEWSTVFKPTDLDGRRLAIEELPLGEAIIHRRPAYGEVRIEGADGVARLIAAAGIPLFSHEDEFVGGLAILWESAEAP